MTSVDKAAIAWSIAIVALGAGFAMTGQSFDTGVSPSPVITTPSMSDEKLWETSAELAQPESVIYDSKRDVLYVSNLNGSPAEQNKMGFLSKISLDGDIIDLIWIDGLDAPKGMAIFDDILYVSDITSLVEIDIKNDKIMTHYEAPESVFLNDVTVDDVGNVYVSDVMTNTIHKLHDGVFEVWLQSPELQSPNGLMVEGDKLVVGSWGVLIEGDKLVVGSWDVIIEGFRTEVPGHLKIVDLHDKSITSLGNGNPIGNLDGVESDGHGNYYVTDWMEGKLLLVQPDGNSETLLDLEPGSADHEVILDKDMLLIPMMQNDIIIAYNIS